MGLILSDASLQTHNKGITSKIKFELGDKNNKMQIMCIVYLMNEN